MSNGADIYQRCFCFEVRAMEITKNLLPIGARIIKSSVAVAFCMVIYYLRTLLPVGSGIPFYSALAALYGAYGPYPRISGGFGDNSASDISYGYHGQQERFFLFLCGISEHSSYAFF